MQIYKDPTDEVPQFLADKYDREASRYWDKFYRRNGSNFFKDRHYLDAEFPQLSAAGLKLLEVGCGAGNTAFPLLEDHPDMYVYACDFSYTAVELVKSHPQYDEGRITAFVANLTDDSPFDAVVAEGSVDIVSMVFVLSAITPERMPQAVRNVAAALRTGGQVLLRDYAQGDLAQVRLAQDGKQQKISEGFYVRGDGTCAYYFEESFLRRLFEAEGLVCKSMEVHERQLENRKKCQVMDRRWIQAVFEKQLQHVAPCEHNAKPRAPGSLDPSSIHFTGAAGRLASQRSHGGIPWLPDTLDSADTIAAEISPANRSSMPEYEAELEREFASIVDRDTDEVVEEEVAALSSSTTTAGLPTATVLDGLDDMAVLGMGSLGAGNGGRMSWGVAPGDFMTSAVPSQLASGEAVNTDSGQDRDQQLLQVSIGSTVLTFHESPPSGGRQMTVLGAAPALARFVTESAAVFAGSNVLELWCGDVPICSLVALRFCRKAVAAIHEPSQLAALRRNVRLNSPNFIIERITCCVGSSLLDSMRRENTNRQGSSKVPPGGFDVIMCSYPDLSQEATAAGAAANIFAVSTPPLLASHPRAMVLLGLTLQSAAHRESVIEAARQAGFREACSRQEELLESTSPSPTSRPPDSASPAAGLHSYTGPCILSFVQSSRCPA